MHTAHDLLQNWNSACSIVSGRGAAVLFLAYVRCIQVVRRGLAVQHVWSDLATLAEAYTAPLLSGAARGINNALQRSRSGVPGGTARPAVQTTDLIYLR